MNALPTRERMLELINLDIETGRATWRVSPASTVRAGDPVGNEDPGGGYVRARIDGRRVLMHRVVWLVATGNWPENFIDHINRVKNDNRISNLREATNAENTRNNDRLGITFHKGAQKWMAALTVNYKTVYLGLHETRGAAIAAAKAGREKHFGKFAA